MATGFPCRYNKCNGVVHTGKCPVASARGSKGGKTTGESKARTGESNGRFKHGHRDCCETLKTSPHHIQCAHARLSMRKNIQTKTNITINPEIPHIKWASISLDCKAVAPMLRGVDGLCGGCDWRGLAIQAQRVHPKDITANPARVICHACDRQ